MWFSGVSLAVLLLNELQAPAPLAVFLKIDFVFPAHIIKALLLLAC